MKRRTHKQNSAIILDSGRHLDYGSHTRCNSSFSYGASLVSTSYRASSNHSGIYSPYQPVESAPNVVPGHNRILGFLRRRANVVRKPNHRKTAANFHPYKTQLGKRPSQLLVEGRQNDPQPDLFPLSRRPPPLPSIAMKPGVQQIKQKKHVERVETGTQASVEIWRKCEKMDFGFQTDAFRNFRQDKRQPKLGPPVDGSLLSRLRDIAKRTRDLSGKAPVQDERYRPYTRQHSRVASYGGGEEERTVLFNVRVENIVMEKKAYSEKVAAYEKQLRAKDTDRPWPGETFHDTGVQVSEPVSSSTEEQKSETHAGRNRVEFETGAYTGNLVMFVEARTRPESAAAGKKAPPNRKRKGNAHYIAIS